MHLRHAILLAVALSPTVVRAQESYKVEVLKQAPPEALSGAIRGVLDAQGYRIVDDQGKSYAEFWLRKATPAQGKPAGPKGAILFPVLREGELLGALRFPGEGHDYRDQTIEPGAYTLRYGLQPVNGDHLGVSPNRDYALLLPAAKDTAIAALPRKKLEEGSSESAGTSHPAILMLTAAPEASPAKGEPALVHDEAKNTWGAVVPLSLAVDGESAPVTLRVHDRRRSSRRPDPLGGRAGAADGSRRAGTPSATLTLTLAHPGRPGSPRDGLTDMSFSLLIALFLAFGFDTPTGPGALPAPGSRRESSRSWAAWRSSGSSPSAWGVWWRSGWRIEGA